MFNVSGLPAGEYHLAAFTDPDASLLGDPAFPAARGRIDQVHAGGG